MLNIIEKIYAAKPSIDDVFDATQFDSNANTDLNALVPRIIGWILWIGFTLIFIYLLISGITLITSSGNAEQAKKGLQGVIYGIIGTVVITLSLVLIKVINQMAHTSAP